MFAVSEEKRAFVEDSDMKIAGSAPRQQPDDGEVAAMEFQHQKQNGNIERAYRLGRRLSDRFFVINEILVKYAGPRLLGNPVIESNAQVLFAFIVDTILEHGCPDSIIAQTALNYFHEQVRERSPRTYDTIVESGAFSLYLLCSRDERMSRSCIGDAFADSCDMEDDPDVVRLGDQLYREYFDVCKEELGRAEFVR